MRLKNEINVFIVINISYFDTLKVFLHIPDNIVYISMSLILLYPILPVYYYQRY